MDAAGFLLLMYSKSHAAPLLEYDVNWLELGTLTQEHTVGSSRSEFVQILKAANESAGRGWYSVVVAIELQCSD